MTKRGILVAFLTVGFIVGVGIKAAFDMSAYIALVTAAIGVIIGFILIKVLGLCGCKIDFGSTYFHFDCKKCEGREDD